MKKLFTVKDKVSETYLPPFAYATSRDAIDAFRVAVKDEQSPYNKHPKDFQLVQIGEYCEREGNVKSIKHEVVIEAETLIKEN